MATTAERTHGAHTLMARSASIDSVRENTPSTVELRVRADADQLSVLRAVAAAIALRQDFDLDTVEDVKLAVDEAATRLITDSATTSTLSCIFETTPGELSIILSAPTRGDIAADRSRSFGWHVLEALTDSVSVSSDADSDGDAGTVATIALTLSEGSSAR